MLTIDNLLATKSATNQSNRKMMIVVLNKVKNNADCIGSIMLLSFISISGKWENGKITSHQ